MIKRSSLRRGDMRAHPCFVHRPIRKNLESRFCRVDHAFGGLCFAKAMTAMADKHSEDAYGAQREQAMGKATAQRKGDSEARVVALPADFRLAELADVKAALIEAFDAPVVHIDGAGVERVDTAALQLLVVFRREAAVRGQSSAWQGVSAVMRDAAALLGVAQVLELPAPMPA